MTPLLLLAGLTQAATLTVDPTDADAYATVSAALAAAASGDRIEIAAGSYTECLDTTGRDISFAGAGEASATLLETDEGCESLLALSGGETVALEALTLTHAGGRAVHGASSALSLTSVTIADSGGPSLNGGAVLLEGGSLTVDGCTFSGNQADLGGAIYATDAASVDATDTLFEGNAAVSGGGGLLAAYDNDLSFQTCTFSGNSSGEGSGGALNVQWYSALDLQDTVFLDNMAAGSGGGLFLYVLQETVTIGGSRFEGNQAVGGSGGGVEHEWYGALEISDTTFANNNAAGYGGGFASWYEAHLTIDSSVFEGNHAASGGGGVFHYPADSALYDLVVADSRFEDNSTDASGGALWLGWVRQAGITGSSFVGNQAATTGGAIEAYVLDTVTVGRGHFCGNQATTGGAVSVEWATTDTWHNNTFVENSADNGGAAYRYASYDGALVNNSFAGNEVTGWGGHYFASWGYAGLVNNVFAHTSLGTGIYADDAHTYANSPVTYDAFWDNEALHAGGYFWVEDGQDGNLVTEPGFVTLTLDGDCDNDDLRLATGSALRDAGDPKRLDPDGSRSDIGAYGGSDAPVEDHDGDGFTTQEDCVDTDDGIFPGATELCDGLDQDCDGEIDEDASDAVSWYPDADGDGYTAEEGELTACEQPSGYAQASAELDCDDGDDGVHPGAEEIAGDGIDQDCDDQDLTLDTGEPPPDDSGSGGEDPRGCGCSSRPVQGGLCWALLLAGVAAARRGRWFRGFYQP